MSIAAQYADLWNDFVFYKRSHPDELTEAQALLDASCSKIGRDPSTIGRTVAVAATPTGRTDADQFGVKVPITGTPEEIARGLHKFAYKGCSHVQVFIHPATIEGVGAFALVVDALDRGV